jgi:hypothetical protein
MNWLPRYLHEIERYLPARNRGDVVDELHSILAEKIADEAERLDRDLAENETLALLQAYGHPLKVASSYSANTELISRELLPLYLLTLRYLVVTHVTLYLAFIVWRNLVIGPTMPGYQFGTFLNVGFAWAGAMTLAFHLIGRQIARRAWLDHWNPRSLPPMGSDNASITGSVFVCMLTLGWLVILNVLPMEHSFALLLGREGNLFLTFVFWLKLQAIIVLPVYILLMFRPSWTPAKRLAIVFADLAIIAGAGLCMSLPIPALPGELAAADWLPTTIRLTLGIWIVAVGFDLGHHLWRLTRSDLPAAVGESRV